MASPPNTPNVRYYDESGINLAAVLGGGVTIDTPATLPSDDSISQDSSGYDFKYRTFPSTLATGYNRHYMLININVSNYSSFQSFTGPGGETGGFTRLENELSTVDALRFNIDPKWVNKDGQTLGPGSLSVPRQTRRIKESIALFIPNTLVWTNSNQYDDVSLTGLVKNGVSAVAGFIPKAGRIINKVIDAASGGVSTAASLAQAPINPRVEVLFSNTALQSFQFDFLFAPVNDKESRALKEIIHTLRFHAAPEVHNYSGGGIAGALKGMLWTPPSEFDIAFFKDNAENLNIPRINTCILEQIDVDHAPSGIYATFSDGYPVKTRLQLRFRNVEVTHRLRIAQGF